MTRRVPTGWPLLPALLLVLLAAAPDAGAETAETSPLFSPLPIDPDSKGAFDEQAAERRWQQLSLVYFGERELTEAQDVVTLEAPLRTEDDAFVPVTVNARTPDGRRIDTIYLIVDINPLPLAGKFTLSRTRPLEQISTRVRVNGYTYVRAVAETDDGRLFMDKQLVKSRGVACAAPPITSVEEAEQNLGKMRFRLVKAKRPDQQDSVQLMISHPNATGMQKDQVSLLYIPEYYVKEVEVSFNDESLLRAETTFTISENPSFRFSFSPDERGELKARIVDTKDNLFVVTSTVGGDGDGEGDGYSITTATR